MMRNKRLKFILVGLMVVFTSFFTACDQGDTGQNEGNPTPGAILVSNGGFGSTLSIDVRGDVRTGDSVGFFVEARDANGAPLQFIQITCDTEQGLALLEPTTGFASTDQNGLMSGVIGGEAPGSYILECRGPVGSGLRETVSLVSLGEIPSGFNGFDGAGGGGLGGGFVDGDVGDGSNEVFVSNVEIQTIAGGVDNIDIVQNLNCDFDSDTNVDVEPFGIDNYVLSITNPTQSAIEIDSISFTLNGATSTVQLNQITVGANGATTLSGPFTAFNGGGTKLLAGTSSVLVPGVFNITFTVSGSFLDETGAFTVTRSNTIVVDNFNNCP